MPATEADLFLFIASMTTAGKVWSGRCELLLLWYWVWSNGREESFGGRSGLAFRSTEDPFGAWGDTEEGTGADLFGYARIVGEGADDDDGE